MQHAIIKQALLAASILCALSAHAEPTDTATLIPGSAAYLDAQSFDIALKFPAPPSFTIVNSWAQLDGQDVSGWFKQCFQPQIMEMEPGTTLLCKRMSGAALGVGMHGLNVDLQLADGSLFHASAQYVVNKTRILNQLPATFLLPGSSPGFLSGINVVPGHPVRITASGRMSTWAANASFPIATPKGSISCNSSICLIPGAMTGALLVKIGVAGRWMVVGDSYTLLPDRLGELIFAVNDQNSSASWRDNIGAYEVTITR